VAARNNAIKISKGDYILPLDGDDMISPDYIKLATDVLDNNKDVILVYCNVERFGNESGILLLPELNKRNILRSGCCVSSSMYRREKYESVGGYKKEMSEGWEDWEFFISLIETGGKVYKLNQILFYYRFLKNSRDRNINKDKADYLKSKIIQLHPNMYFEEYDKLLTDYESIISSRSYKIMSFFTKILHG
jgi:glycosyltransferase involved in cell wall biosynthesis